jgi:hypothetical protein
MEMRPLFNRSSLYVYPIYATIGASFGFWLQGVNEKQLKLLSDRRESLLEKRRRRDAREAEGEDSVLSTTV